MTEKDLIRQLKMLREIKPRKDWVVLTKERMFSQEIEQEPKMSFVLSLPFIRHKLALAPVISVLIIIGLFGFAQKTVPGDPLFSVKKITETVQVGFSSNVEKAGVQLKLANKRLEELGKIAQANDVRNLGPAIEEYRTCISEAVRSINAVGGNVALKEIADEAKKLEENQQKINALGVEIGETKEFNNALAQLVERELQYLEGRTLSDSQQPLLAEAKEAFDSGDYSQALIKILDINKLYLNK